MTKAAQVLSQASYPPAGGFTTWNNSYRKRLFDLALAGVLLLLLSPLFVIIAIAVALDSSGPVLFRQKRMGKDGRLFWVFKFRTMTHDSTGNGLKITRAGDLRITRLGRVLRKTKLDELPQLFNVLRGDMSFIGPRPDLPEFLESLTPPQGDILCLRPGITGMASIQYRNEEQLLANVQPEALPRYYSEHVLPIKIRIDLEYAQRAGFFSDIGVLFGTVRAMLR
jgi:lipopolysaccharide/colanic/teichoic acid biosynthesis glycosyltransferase